MVHSFLTNAGGGGWGGAAERVVVGEEEEERRGKERNREQRHELKRWSRAAGRDREEEGSGVAGGRRGLTEVVGGRRRTGVRRVQP